MGWWIRKFGSDLVITDPDGVEHNLGPIDGAAVSVDQVLPALLKELPSAADMRAYAAEKVRETLDQWPRPKDGASVTLADVMPELRQRFDDAVAAIPRPKDGASVTLADVLPHLPNVTTILPPIVLQMREAVDAAVMPLQAQVREAIDSIRVPEDGARGPMPAHEWNGTRLRFQNPDGSWGAWRDLEGRATAFAGGLSIAEVNALIAETGGTVAYRFTSVDTIATDDDDVIFATDALTVTLMDPASRTRPLHVKRTGSGDVVLLPSTGTIDGDPQKTIATQYTSLMLVPAGADWFVL